MRLRSRLLTVAATLTTAGGLATAGTATAASQAAADPTPRLTAQARAAGITEVGGAFMGWSAPGRTVGTRTRTPAGAAGAAGGTDGATAAAPLGKLGGTNASTPRFATSGVEGIDVSSWQGNVDWQAWWRQGRRFAYVKATESTGYINPYFAQQYNGSYRVGMIRGSYHFALPNRSSGAAQADYFIRHGGGWSRDGKTLPGVLDIEYNPYGQTCYDMTQAEMRSWISAFTKRYKARTGRDAVIYSNYDWWNRCTGNTTAFNRTNPLWVARYASSVGTLPGQWPYHTFWQYTSTPIDMNRFNGSYSRLRALALG